MRKILLASLALAACGHDRVIAVRPGAEIPKMTVTGTATLDVSPDCADLTMTLSSDSPKPLLATTDVEKKEAALVASLTKAGIAHDDMKLSTLELQPVYAPNPTKPWAPYAITGYRAAIVITVTTRDFAKIGPLVDTGAESGATALTTQFRRSDIAQLKVKVRDMAIAAAQDKAKQTAHDLGISLGGVVSVAENPGGALWSNAYFPNAAARMNTSGAELGAALQPLTLDITIAYELPMPS
jgi:uncharacterized protein YggE